MKTTLQTDEIVFIKPSAACRRTKNRIHERGSEGFKVVRTTQHVDFDDKSDRRWVLLTSLDGSDWLGWLPIDEIEVVG